MKKRLKIQELQISSFVTSLSDANQSKILTGVPGTTTLVSNVIKGCSVPQTVFMNCTNGPTEVPSQPCCGDTGN